MLDKTTQEQIHEEMQLTLEIRILSQVPENISKAFNTWTPRAREYSTNF